jgi:N utilization substance protein A
LANTRKARSGRWWRRWRLRQKAAQSRLLTQSDEEPESEDGSGLINDEVAEERIAELTEVGPDLDGEGAESLVPGREDTSELLAEHEVHPEVDGDESVIEDSVEEVRDEEVGEKKFDE